MDIPFFYQDFEENAFTEWNETSAHHALHVLRMQDGAPCYWVNGSGLKALVHIRKKGKTLLSPEIISVERVAAPTHTFHLALALPKQTARTEWMLEKLTEIGLQQFTPLLCEHSERQHVHAERIQKILIAAMLQSQQAWLPILHPWQKPEQVLQGTESLKLIAHCRANMPRQALTSFHPIPKQVLFMIGPEGDFSEQEIHHAQELGAHSVHLGNHRLRTETAGIFAGVAINLQFASS